MSQAPVPRPRTKSVQLRRHRDKLFESFDGFSSGVVEQRHVELARVCINAGENQYMVIPFHKLLEQNQVSTCCGMGMGMQCLYS